MRIINKICLIAFLTILSGSLNLGYGSDMASSSFEEFVSNPTEYDSKQIVVEGTIENLKFTTADGGKYTLFKMADDAENILNVYYQGDHLNLKKGTVVTVVGEFQKQKRYSIYNFKNVVKAKDVIIGT